MHIQGLLLNSIMLQNFHDKSVYQVATSANEKYIKLWFAIFIRFTKCMPQSLIKLESFIKLDSVECKINIRSERTQNYEMITWIMMQSLIIFSKIIETELLISNGSSILLWKQTNRNLGTCRSPWPRQGAMQGGLLLAKSKGLPFLFGVIWRFCCSYAS